MNPTRAIAESMYHRAALLVAQGLRREGKYVCIASVQARMPEYNQDILKDVLFAMALSGELSEGHCPQAK